MVDADGLEVIDHIEGLEDSFCSLRQDLTSALTRTRTLTLTLTRIAGIVGNRQPGLLYGLEPKAAADANPNPIP